MNQATTILTCSGCSNPDLVENVAEGGLGLVITKGQLERISALASSDWSVLELGLAAPDIPRLRLSSVRQHGAGTYAVGCQFVNPSASWQRTWRKCLMKAQASQLLIG